MSSPFKPSPRICSEKSGKIKRTETVSPAPVRLPALTATEYAGPCREVECFVCRKFSTVPAGAVSAKCAHCYAFSMLDDVNLHSRTHRRTVKTWGTVTVQAGADLSGVNIECKDLVLNGRVSGHLHCHGVCKVKTDQHISGRVSARRLMVEKKTDVVITEGVYVVNAMIHGVLEAIITAEDTVTIHRNGKVLGDIVTRQLSIEAGGVHQGKLTGLS